MQEANQEIGQVQQGMRKGSAMKCIEVSFAVGYAAFQSILWVTPTQAKRTVMR